MQFPSAAESEAGLRAYNAFLAEVWSFKQAEIEASLAAAARELAEGEDKIRAIERLEPRFDAPPELRFEGDIDRPGRLRVVFALPGGEGWGLFLRARLKLPFPFGSPRLDVHLRKLRVEARLELDRRSPLDITLAGNSVDVIFDDLKLDSSNFLVKIVARLASGILELLESLIERVARKQLEDLLPDPEGLQRLRDLGLGDVPVDFAAPPPDLAALEDPAKAVARRLREEQMPWSTVLNGLVPPDAPDAAPEGFRQFEDSAIWTGHFLAGEVLRHELTGDPEALENITAALDGLEALTRLTDETGQLSRVRVPLGETEIVAALDAERVRAGHQDRLFTSVDERFRAIGHITRDQYTGALLGTGIAATRLPDGPLRERARGLALEMVDYLVRHKFCPTEAVADPATGRKGTSVTYIAHPTQVLAALQLGRTLDPQRYAERYAAFEPAWAVQWLFQWLPSLDVHDSYFKFNLEHAAAWLLLGLETDRDRRAHLAQGLQVVRHAIRHHANAWFNLVELLTLGDFGDDALSRPRREIEAETRHVLAQAFERSPVIEPISLRGDAEIETVVHRKLGSDRTEEIARRPVDVRRRPGTDFLWQRSPFALDVVWDLPEDLRIRPPGIDLTLPFWLARRLGL